MTSIVNDRRKRVDDKLALTLLVLSFWFLGVRGYGGGA